VRQLLETSTTEEIKEAQNNGLNDILQVLENMEKETRTLQEEKISLLDAEERLLGRINEEIEKKRQKIDQLKVEVEELRKRCEILTNFVNAQIA
jgi:predicted transcriptional regulator